MNGLKGLQHICITVKDMEESLAFYRDGLGMTVWLDIELPHHNFIQSELLDLCMLEKDVKTRMCLLMDGGGTVLELHEWRGEGGVETPEEFLRYSATGVKELAWSVSDMDEIVKELEAKGLEFRTPIWPCRDAETGEVIARSILMTDPNGITVQFVEIPD